tara:strand:- start:275 stop:664 length:390 start_codon:yes stop_codon:yes gene_type:complete
MSIDLNKETHFIIDYSSNACCIGIIYENKESNSTTMMVTDLDCGPMDMAEAKEIFWDDSVPDHVIHIPLNNEFHQVREQCLGAILASHYVSYVVDSEMAYEFPSLVCDASQNLFTLQAWFKMRNITGIL